MEGSSSLQNDFYQDQPQNVPQFVGDVSKEFKNVFYFLLIKTSLLSKYFSVYFGGTGWNCVFLQNF